VTFWRFPPPPTQRVATRLAGANCGFCLEAERTDQFWTGRIVSVPHSRRAICEACIEYADEMAACARLARIPAKAKPGPRRLATLSRLERSR
jgi:hypothetical protein